MNLSSWVSDTSLPAAKVHFFPHSISVQAAHNIQVARLRLKQSFDGLDSFRAWSMKEGI